MVDIWLFHPKKFYSLCSKEIFLVLSRYMQPKKEPWKELPKKEPWKEMHSILIGCLVYRGQVM
jgi:hypothetical protein